MGKAGEINPLGCDTENISYNSLMEIMGVVSERLQANTDTIKHDMINWLTKLRKQLLEANGGHTEADLQRELSRKSKLLDAYLDGILNKQEYQKKAEELDERIIQLKAETEKNKANSGDIAEIDKVLANIDEEVSRYVDGNEKLKVEYLLEHLKQVQIFPDKVIVIVPILSEGIVVEKAQYVSREKRSRKNNTDENTCNSASETKREHFCMRYSNRKCKSNQKNYRLSSAGFSIYPTMNVIEVMDYLGILSGIGSRERKKRIELLLKKVNLIEQKNKKVKALSGGMKRRLGIAQALLMILKF